MSWSDVQDSEYVFKSNVQKHVIEMKGIEIGDTRDSLIIAYYNVYTGTPMILMYRVEEDDVGPIEDVAGFKAVKEPGKNADGSKYTETIYIDNEIRMALS